MSAPFENSQCWPRLSGLLKRREVGISMVQASGFRVRYIFELLETLKAKLKVLKPNP